MYEENPRQIDFASSECEFQVSKGTSYQELTVAKNPYLTITFFIPVPECTINDTYNIYIFLLTSLN